MKRFRDQRIVVLVDAETLEIGARDLHSRRVDYVKLISKVNGRQMIRAIYYRPEPQLGTNFDGFRHVLETQGFEIKSPPKNADCWLTIDAVTLAEKSDVVVLIGGDKDYLPLVWFLKSRGVRVEVWMWAECTSRAIKEAVDEFIPLDSGCLRNSEQNETNGGTEC